MKQPFYSQKPLHDFSENVSFRFPIKRISEGRLSPLALFFILATASCVPVTRPPEAITYEQVPSYAWEGLKNQRSFNFDYFISRGSLSFSVSGKGSVVLPDALRFRGTWKLGEEVRTLDLVAAGDYELDREDGEWIARQRSEEGRVMEQVDRIVRDALLIRNNKGFTLLSEEGRTLRYSFKPNIAFLDPGFQKKFSGELVVDRNTLLAKEIKGFSDDSDIVFNFKVRSLNQKRGIDMPYAPNFLVSYSLGSASAIRAKTVMKARLADLGRKNHIQTGMGRLQASLTLPVDEAVAKSIAGEGRLYLVSLSLKGGGQRINTRGQATDIFYITDTLARPKVGSAELRFDSLSRPWVEVSLKNSGPGSSFQGFADYIGVVVDGILYEVLPIDSRTEIVKIANVPTYQEALALAVKLRKPLKGTLVFESEEKLK